MEMWITHNRSNVEYSTVKYSVSPEYYKPVAKKMSKCLISYYGITNETCWYPSKIESAEADVQDTLGEQINIFQIGRRWLNEYFDQHAYRLYDIWSQSQITESLVISCLIRLQIKLSWKYRITLLGMFYESSECRTWNAVFT